MHSHHWLKLILLGFAWGPLIGLGSSQGPGVMVIYETGFEFEEGYDPELTLVGQNNWVGEGTGGNGLVEEFFPGLGQQAFIGFAPPAEGESILNVWRPIQFAPRFPEHSVVKFEVLMQIVDSTFESYDDFRWSVYNDAGVRMFTLDFDNHSREISYALDTGGFIPTGNFFDNEGIYELVIQMNFARNLWTASLNGLVVVNSQPITRSGAELTLGDIDAVWAIRDPNSPGDNFMLFDNYRISAETDASIPPVVETLGMVNGEFLFRIFGEEGVRYSVDVTSDFVEWFSLGTYPAPAGGIFDFQDDTAPEHPLSFYRVRAVD
jgi:hypothetical protein